MTEQQGFRKFHFLPTFFRQENVELAKSVILSPVINASTDERWKLETDYSMNIISQNWKINADTMILDFGCGIGRMAKALIEKYGCTVIGVDTEPNMQAYSIHYVYSERFFPCSPTMLNKLGIKFDYALGIWVFLHAIKPAEDIKLIKKHLKLGGKLFVINEHGRRIPTTEEIMVDDGVKVADLLAEEFETKIYDKVTYLPNEDFSNCAFYGMYEKK